MSSYQQEVYLRSCDLTISKNKIDIAELMNVARIQHEKRLHDEQEINRLEEKLGRIERSFVFRAVRWLSNDLLAFASSRKLP